jgi:hypothetical protein
MGKAASRLVLLALLSMVAPAANAAELLMFRSPGCAWCAAWDQAIGPIYPKTEVGRRAPVRMVALDEAGSLDIALQRPVRYSPTFVLVEDKREIGRIEGFPGEDFFWGLLENLVLKLEKRRQTDAFASGGNATPAIGTQQSPPSQMPGRNHVPGVSIGAAPHR